MIIDRHHLILYGIVVLVAAIGAYAYHSKALDVAEAKAKAAAQDQIVATFEKRIDEREKEFKDQIATLLAMKSTPATTPAQIVERIPQYFPQLQPTVQQPINPQTGKPDESKPAQLVFDAPQAKLLNDQLVDCKVCQVERDKLKLDLADYKTKIIPAKDKEIGDWKTAAKGGSILKRTGKALLVMACAGGGAYAAHPQGSTASGIGAAAGALACTIAMR